jgi:hypothetical protein
MMNIAIALIQCMMRSGRGCSRTLEYVTGLADGFDIERFRDGGLRQSTIGLFDGQDKPVHKRAWND